MTQSVRDCAAALDASAGADVGAPYAAPPYADSLAAVEAVGAGAPLRSLRIALLSTTLDEEPVHPEVAAAVQEAAAVLGTLGHHVESAAPKVATDEIVRPMMNVIACGTAMVIDLELRKRGRALQADDVEPTTRGAWEYGRGLTGPQLMESIAAMHRIDRLIGAFFAGSDAHPGFDAMVLPVLAEPPAQLGRWAMSNPDFLDYRLGAKGLIRYSPFTPLANMTGQPAISLPLAMSSQGLPIGVQLVGRFGEDARLLELAAQLELAMPWRERIAPLALAQ